MIRLLSLLMVPVFTFAAMSNLAIEFNAAKQLATEHESQAAFDCYFSCEFDPHFEKNFESVMSECFDSSKIPNTDTFEVIVALNKNGVIISSWLEPKTNIGQCLSDALKGAPFPHPPFSPFYASIVMQISD